MFEEFQEENLETEQEQPQNQYWGLSTTQIIVLAVLGFLIFVSLGFFVNMVIRNNLRSSSAAQVVVQPTYTLVPTETPLPTPTQAVISTPIPDWTRFEFADSKAFFYLPVTYQGGDTVAYFDIVILTLETFVSDALYVDWAKNFIRENQIQFFAFDSVSADIGTDAFVAYEHIPIDLHTSMDDYLNNLMDQFSASGGRVIDRRIVQLDYYEAGRLFVDTEADIGDTRADMRLAIYTIRSGDTIWVVTYRTAKSDFDLYLPTIELSIRSFFVQP